MGFMEYLVGGVIFVVMIGFVVFFTVLMDRSSRKKAKASEEAAKSTEPAPKP